MNNLIADVSPNETPVYDTQCEDGTWSDSEGSGTCSHHGGIKQSSTLLEYYALSEVLNSNNDYNVDLHDYQCTDGTYHDYDGLPLECSVFEWTNTNAEVEYNDDKQQVFIIFLAIVIIVTIIVNYTRKK